MVTFNSALTDKGLILRKGTAVDATLIAAPSSNNNKDGECEPEMQQTKKVNQWHFGMKVNISLDADSGLDHTLVGTAAKLNDAKQASKLARGEEADVFPDAGYKGVTKREEKKGIRQTGMWRCDQASAVCWTREGQCVLSWTSWSRPRHVSGPGWNTRSGGRVNKRQFGCTKVRYWGMVENAPNLVTLFALSKLWMACRSLLLGQKA